jgi:cytochrome bd-type quinol oxidase subunit 2
MDQSRPTPNLKDHPFSIVIFVAAFHIWRTPPKFVTRGTHLTWQIITQLFKDHPCSIVIIFVAAFHIWRTSPQFVTRGTHLTWLIITQLFKIFPTVMEPEISLQCSLTPANGTFSEPIHLSPHPHIIFPKRFPPIYIYVFQMVSFPSGSLTKIF